VIHSAATRALIQGTTLDSVIEMVSTVSPQLKAPLVLFTYFNPILRKGVERFCQQIKAAGASGALWCGCGMGVVWVRMYIFAAAAAGSRRQQRQAAGGSSSSGSSGRSSSSS